jgi:hypothetical protein
MSKPPANSRTSGFAIFSFSLLFAVCWAIAGLVTWWAYSISALIQGGYYKHGQAFLLVAGMLHTVQKLISVRRNITGEM